MEHFEAGKCNPRKFKDTSLEIIQYRVFDPLGIPMGFYCDNHCHFVELSPKSIVDFSKCPIVPPSNGRNAVNKVLLIHVITPVFSAPNFAAKREVIEKVAAHHGVEVRFPDYLPHRSVFDLRSLEEELESANLVLVDLSGERPSCYY